MAYLVTLLVHRPILIEARKREENGCMLNSAGNLGLGLVINFQSQIKSRTMELLTTVEDDSGYRNQ